VLLGQSQNTVKIELEGSDSEALLHMVVKTMGKHEERIGSISMPQEVFFKVGESRHTQWITLFDHEDDDIYDGEMGLDDEEAPMVRMVFEIEKEEAPRKRTTPEVVKEKAPQKHSYVEERKQSVTTGYS